MKNDYSESERNYGIDLLRIVLSFCVITIHILYYGGFRTHADPTDFSFFILWFLGIVIDCTVNCFALLSGFVLYGKEVKYTNLFRLFLIVLYHGIFINIAFQAVMPGSVTFKNVIQGMLPVSYNEFWYFTAYFGAFFFFPVLTQGMRSLSKKQADILVFSLLLFFSVLPTLTDCDPFDAELGYSTIWLLVLFVIGTYLKKYFGTFTLSRGKLIAVFVLCILITSAGAGISVENPSFDGMRLIEYTSPTIVLAGITVVLLFASLTVPTPVRKLASFCAPATFSIYLLHEHPLVRQYIISDKFLPVLSMPSAVQIIVVLASTLLVWAVCFALEYIRHLIFQLLKIDQALQNIERRLAEQKQKNGSK